MGAVGPRLEGAARRTARRFCADRRGGTAVQMMILLPVILIAFVAGAKLWETLLIRRSLHTGTYEAARYLALYPPQGTNPDLDWAPIATRFVAAELRNNPFVDSNKPIDAQLQVEVELTDGGNQCADRFKVRSEYRFIGPLGQRGAMGLPEGAWVTLVDEVNTEVICD